MFIQEHININNLSNTRMKIVLSFCLLLAIISAMQQFDSGVKVTYGSLIKMTNPSSQLIVHSHNVFFGRGGVMSITGYHIDDLGSYWQVNQAHQIATKSVTDPVFCGDTITISSAIQDYFIRTQQTQFGLTTQLLPMVHGIKRDGLDSKINWQVQCLDKEPGADLHFSDLIRLKHRVTGKYVSLDPAYAYTEANCGRGCSIAGQIELHAIDSTDETTSVFTIKTGIAFDPLFVGQEDVEVKEFYLQKEDFNNSKRVQRQFKFHEKYLTCVIRLPKGIPTFQANIC